MPCCLLGTGCETKNPLCWIEGLVHRLSLRKPWLSCSLKHRLRTGNKCINSRGSVLGPEIGRSWLRCWEYSMLSYVDGRLYNTVFAGTCSLHYTCIFSSLDNV